MMKNFGFSAAKNAKPAEAPPPDDLSDFQPGEAHAPDPATEARMDRAAADAGFPPRDPEDTSSPVYQQQTGHRRRPPKEPATQLTLHIPQRVATRFATFCDDRNFRSYWSALEYLMDKGNVPK